MCFSRAGAPFEVLAGEPGYINVMDALLGWQLVREAQSALGPPVAASFKHLSPAGAALSGELSAGIGAYCQINAAGLSPIANAYLRARSADPLSSFGDLAAVSDTVDETLAQLLKNEFSDGIIAPDYHPQALKILRAKKKGRFIILRANPDWQPPSDESREIFGVILRQQRNEFLLRAEELKTVTRQEHSPQAIRDLCLGLITTKYTQSNSICFSWKGQVVGVGAGQQSRVDAIILAGRKAQLWRIRQHPLAVALSFQPQVPRQQKINAIVDWLDDRLTPIQRPVWESLFTVPPKKFPPQEYTDWMSTWEHLCMASDAFLPFRDNVDQAARFAVAHIAQCGGALKDEEVISACNEHGISMSLIGVRLFTH